MALCHCSCGQCEFGVWPRDDPRQGGLCDFCFGAWDHVPQHNTYVNRCSCECDGCYRGRERLGILHDDETWGSVTMATPMRTLALSSPPCE